MTVASPRHLAVKLCRLCLCAFALQAGISTTRGCEPVVNRQEKTNDVLIDELQSVSSKLIGCDPDRSCSTSVLECRERITLCSPYAAPSESSAFVELVRRGLPVLPALLAHLDDRRKCFLVIASHDYANNDTSLGGHVITPRAASLRYDCSVAPLLNEYFDRRYQCGSEVGEANLLVHHVTVGDLCFVAIGQIVNRRFIVIRNLADNEWVVHSPTACPELAQFVRSRYSHLTSSEHERRLLNEAWDMSATCPDETRSLGAVQRLSAYYPSSARFVIRELMMRELFSEDDVIDQIDAMGLNSFTEGWETRWTQFRNKATSAEAIGAVKLLYQELDTIAWKAKCSITMDRTPGHHSVSDADAKNALLCQLLEGKQSVEFALSDVGGMKALLTVASWSEQYALFNGLGPNGYKCVGDSGLEFYRSTVRVFGRGSREAGEVSDAILRVLQAAPDSFSAKEIRRIKRGLGDDER